MGAPLLVARLVVFVAKIKKALQAAGKIGPLLLQIFSKLDEIAELIAKLVKALRRKVDEAVESATDVVTKIVRRSGKRVKPAVELPCFTRPANVDAKDFKDQLEEQQNAINNTDLSELIERRNNASEVGTGAIRNASAQTKLRDELIDKKVSELIAKGELEEDAIKIARSEASVLDATHVLDIIAGGDPTAFSPELQNRSVNRSIGSEALPADAGSIILRNVIPGTD